MEKISEYLKENSTNEWNPNPGFTEQVVNETRQRLANEKWIGAAATKHSSYVVIVNDIKFHLDYEEMVELLCAMRDCSLGNEAFVSAKLKAEQMRSYLPVTNY